MAEASFFPEVVGAPSPPDLAARVAELERVVATLTSLSRERAAREHATRDRPDPVALTAALHPGGMRSARGAKRGSSNDGTLAMRFVLLDPSASR